MGANNIVHKRDESPELLLKNHLDSLKSAMSQILPKHMTPERMVKIVLSCAQRDPKILQCTLSSVGRAVMQAAELGLEIGGLRGEAYLVPFNKNFQDKAGTWQSVRLAQCIPGYRGYVKLALRSGRVSNFYARVVYERDDFDAIEGTDERIVHRPYLGKEPKGELIAVYAVVKFKDGTTQFELMSRDEIDEIKAFTERKNERGFKDSKDLKKPETPWNTTLGFPGMAKKSAVLRISKMLDLSPEYNKALELEDEIEESERTILAQSEPSPLARPDPIASIAEKLNKQSRKLDLQSNTLNTDPETGEVMADEP